MENKYFVEKVNVPNNKQSLTDLTEYRTSCLTFFGDNRWKKMWHDHRFVEEHREMLANIQFELKVIKSLLEEMKNSN